MGITKIVVKEHPGWIAMSQAEKQPVLMEADGRFQERLVKKRALIGWCLKLLRRVCRIGRKLGGWSRDKHKLSATIFYSSSSFFFFLLLCNKVLLKYNRD